MKTSKIILISFFALIVAVLAVVTSKYFYQRDGEYAQKIAEDKVQIEEDVPAFNHLVVEKGVRVWVKSSEDKSYFKFQEHKDSVVIMPKYEMRGDTLVLTSVDNSSNAKVSLHTPTLTSYVAKGRIEMQNYDSIYDVKVLGGRVAFHGNKTKHLSLDVQDGRVDFWGNQLESLEAKVVNSEVYLKKCKMGSANIKASNESKVSISQTLKLSVKKDNSSKVTVR